MYDTRFCILFVVNSAYVDEHFGVLGLDIIKSAFVCFYSSDVAAREYQAAALLPVQPGGRVAGLVLGTLPAAEVYRRTASSGVLLASKVLRLALQHRGFRDGGRVVPVPRG